MYELNTSIIYDSMDFEPIRQQEDAPVHNPSQSLAKDKSLNLLMGNLTEAAAMAYGSGVGEGIKGGKGHIGVLNGKVVKFNTKLAERRNLQAGSEVYGEMMKASDNLRCRLASNLAMVENLFSGRKSDFAAKDGQLLALKTELSGLLGLKLEGGKLVRSEEQRFNMEGTSKYELSDNRSLLTRAAVAKSVTLIRDFLKEHVKTGGAAGAPSTLVKNDEAGERADFDFRIWSKVKAMKGLSSQAISIDGFEYSKQAAEALKEVTLIKAGCRRDGRPFLALQRIGNDKMKEAIGPIWMRGSTSHFGDVTLNMGGKLYEGIPQKKAGEMVRAFRLQSMAESMDEMFGALHKLYNHGLPAGAPKSEQPPRAVSELGATPFKDLFLRSLAKLRGKSVQDIAAQAPDQRHLSQNELRNLKAMMRNELQAFVLNQGNEFEPGQAGAKPKISVETMFVKDFLISCARLLDLDGDAGDNSYIVGLPNGDHSGRDFGPDDTGKTVFGDGDYKIFSNEIYGVNDDILLQISRDETIAQLKDEASANVLKAIFDTTREVQVSGSEDPASVKILPERFRSLVQGDVKKVLGKLNTSGPTNPELLKSLREDFVKRMVSLDTGINVDTRRYVLDENNPQGVTAREMMQEFVGDIFDRYLAAIEWPKAL